MPFPESTRVVFEKNPLVEVTCQLRFPRLLRLDNERPVDFQEVIRKDYPEYSEQHGVSIPEMPGVTQPNSLTRPLHSFKSQDGEKQVGLSSDFIAFSTTRYDNWEQYFSELQPVIGEFISLYAPAYFNRTGLRYKNLIKRTVLDLAPNSSWSELLKGPVLGELGDDQIAQATEMAYRVSVIRLANTTPSQVRVQHGFVFSKDDDEKCYIVDADFYSEEKLNWDGAESLLAIFRKKSGHLFRWMITPRLAELLGDADV